LTLSKVNGHRRKSIGNSEKEQVMRRIPADGFVDSEMAVYFHSVVLRDPSVIPKFVGLERACLSQHGEIRKLPERFVA
jgi:hypothetical protein